jgi:predicted CoA-binding protein
MNHKSELGICEPLSLDVHPKVFWMQLGISNEEAERKSKEKWYRCMMEEHKRLFSQ